MGKAHLLDSFRIFLNAHRDANRKRGPYPDLAFDINRPFHHIDNALGNGKSKTRPLLFTNSRCPFPGKFIKKMLLVLRTHADTRILNNKLIQAIAFAL